MTRRRRCPVPAVARPQRPGASAARRSVTPGSAVAPLECRAWLVNRGGAQAPHGARLPQVQLSLLSTALQRTNRHPVQRSPVPDGYRAARRALASALQAQLPRRGRTAPRQRLRGHPRDDPELRVPLRAAPGAPAPGQAARPRRGLLVHRRDLHEGRGPLVLPLSGHRPRWRPSGLHAQRAPRQARRAALPAAAGRGGRHQAAARHHRCPSGLPPGDSLDPGEKGAAPMPSLLEQPDRAKPPGCQTALLPHARLREFSRPPPASVPPSTSYASTFAFANDEPNGCRSLHSDGSSSSAGGH